MNIIKTKVNFEKRTCVISGVNLTSGDYNSTKMEFTFDRDDGIKILEMINPSAQLVYLGEIINNEVILVGKADITTIHENVTYIKYLDSSDNVYWYDKESEKLYDNDWQEVASFDLEDYTKQTKDCSLFTEEGDYVFEISLYDGDSKLTSAFNKLKVLPQQVSVDDEVAEVYLPVFDEMISELSEAINEVDNLDISMTKSGTVATITITKKNGTQETKNIYDGEKGDTGPYYTPSVDDSGNISWTNNGGLENPTTKNIKGPKGDTGATGSDGVSPVANVTKSGTTATITITDKTGTTSASVSDGTNGQDGYSPTATVSKNGTTATISVTDKNGTTTASISDGSDGETGATGNGIASITKTGTSGLVDTYTVTYTNGNSTTFTVTNGKGISSIAKTGTSGLVDTYTITYNDGTTSTYTVTNGEDGEVTQQDFDYFKKIENALVKVTGSGESITLDDTAECPLKLGLKGNTGQETTTGKNFLYLPLNTTETINDVTITYNNDGTIKLNGTASATINKESSAHPIDARSTTTNYVNRLVGELISGTLSANISYTYITSDWSNSAKVEFKNTGLKNTTLGEYLYTRTRFSIPSGTVCDNAVIKLMVLNNNDNVNTFEKYSGSYYDSTNVAMIKTPAPNASYSQDAHVVSGSNTIKIEGKNVFNKTDSIVTGYYLNNTGGITASTTDFYQNKYIPTIGNKVSVRCTTNYTKILEYDENQNFIHYTGLSTSQSLTISLQNSTKYIRVSGNVNTLDTLQIEFNSSVTDYIPYQSQSYPITLPSGMELCKIGDYQDYIYKSSGKWYKYGVNKKLTLNGEESITLDSYSLRFIITPDDTYQQNGYSNRYIYGSTYQETGKFDILANGKLAINYPNDNVQTVETLRTYLANNETYFYLPLVTPIVTEITDTTLVSQLNALEYAISYQGQTNISQTSNDKPFIINASAFADMNIIISKLTNAIIELGGE